MNFQLQSLAPAAAAATPCDLLVMLVPQSLTADIAGDGDAAAPTGKAQATAKTTAKTATKTAAAKATVKTAAKATAAVDSSAVDPLAQLARAACQHGDFTPEAGKQLHLYQSPGIAARRVLLLGAGAGTVQDTRKAFTAAAPVLRAEGVRHALVCLCALPDAAAAVLASVQCVSDAVYTYTLTKPKAKPAALSHITLAVSDAAASATAAAFATGQAIAQGQALAREWGNRPANHATPTLLAQAAQELTQHPGISCTVHGPKEVAHLGMGAFLAVAQGSKEPLQFIELHYRAPAHRAGASKNGKTTAKTKPIAASAGSPIVLVGKGITFDTGGISLKPAAAMDEMKFDMCGAASVLGTFRALAALQPEVDVIGLIPACENMPDGGAVKPGDVVTSMAGHTIEVLNTDAEGRLLLCDALTYAARFQPAALIDIATLTGACVIALGGVRTGMYATTDDLAQALLDAGNAAQDLCWRMPLDDEYADGLKSNFADLGNVAGRQAGSVTAAKFLQTFVDKDTPWAHLDIAGTAWKEGAAKGATGRPVPLLVNYLLHEAARRQAASTTTSGPTTSAADTGAGRTAAAPARPKGKKAA